MTTITYTPATCEICNVVAGPCDRCGATGPLHRYPEYQGGRGWTSRQECCNTTACEARREGRG